MTLRACTICGKPIVLVPSAAERAAKDKAGNPPSYYTNLFTVHAECEVKKRSESAIALMRRLTHPH